MNLHNPQRIWGPIKKVTIMATDKSKHLDEVLTSHKIKKEQALLDKHVEKRKEVVDALQEKYGSNLYTPFNSGSYAKHTAVNKKFDFDLIAPYKRNAFSTLEKMYNDVYDFLYEKYKGEATIRKQKVSIGLDFYVDSDGDAVKIDVVPGRELNQDKYNEDNNLNLYVYDQFGKIEKGSDRLKSNIKLQIENVKSNADRTYNREIIRLLKIWKLYNGKTPKSFFIELITIKAFDKKDVKGNLWERLKIVLEFIRDEVKSISLADPGNTSNDVSDTLTDLDKTILSDDMKFMIDKIESDSDSIKSYFRINPKFPSEEEEKKENSYGKKIGLGLSVPPENRFG